MNFFAGMAVGMFGGCALGILIMCLCAAAKCSDCAVASQMMRRRFVDTGHIEE